MGQGVHLSKPGMHPSSRSSRSIRASTHSWFPWPQQQQHQQSQLTAALLLVACSTGSHRRWPPQQQAAASLQGR